MIDGNVFTDNSASRGGAIYNTGTIETITSTFTDNEAVSFGAAINNQGTITTITGSTFENSTSGSYGGAIINGSGASIGTISDSKFTNNTSEDNYGGGAIYLTNGSTIDLISNVTFTGNAAKRDETGSSLEYKGSGGAISNFMGGTITLITESSFDGNTAENNGGAISNSNMVRGTQAGSYIGEISDSEFTNNSAVNNGGAISNEFITAAGDASTIALISGSTFTGNSATNGGAISNAEGTEITSIASSSFTGNSASALGGAIYNAGTMGISDATITGNTAGENGGGIYLDSTATFTLGGTNNITGNTVNGEANDIYSNGADITITDGTTTVGALTTTGAVDVNDGATLAITSAGDIASLTIGNSASLRVAGADVAVSSAMTTGSASTVTVRNGAFSATTLALGENTAVDIENGTVNANTLTLNGSIDLKLDNGTLDTGSSLDLADSRVTFNNGTLISDGDITLASLVVAGQATIDAGGKLTLNSEYTGEEGDDVVLTASDIELFGSFSSENGSASLTATNALTANGALTLSGDTLSAGQLILTDTLTASNSSVVRVEKFGTDDTSALGQAVSVTGGSWLIHGDGAGSYTPSSSYDGQSAYFALSTLRLVEGGSLQVGEVDGANENNTVVFGENSVLVIDAGKVESGSELFSSAVEGAVAYVAESSSLYLVNPTANGEVTYTFFGENFEDIDVEGWTTVETDTDLITVVAVVTENGLTATIEGVQEEAGGETEEGGQTGTGSGTNVTITTEVNDPTSTYPGLSDEMGAALVALANNGIDIDSNKPGTRFLSRATSKLYIANDKSATVRVIESAGRMALAGAVPQMAKMASDASTNAIVNRLGLANPSDPVKAMDINGMVSEEKKTGLALWLLPLWQNMHGFGMEAGKLDYGFNANLGGIAIGADYTFDNALRVGLTLNMGGGYAESEGDLSSTTNRMNFWGIGLYGGWEYQNFALLGDVAYTKTFNSLDQDVDRGMDMNNLEADVEASVISAGLRAEYKIVTPILDLLPHVGARYMSVNVYGYDIENNLGTVVEGDSFHQSIWTFPIGISFMKDFHGDNGWFFSPLLDFSIIPAAGDVKARHDVSFTGVPGSYELESQMMDYFTWQGSAGVKFGNDVVNVGINYALQAGANSTGHGVYGVLRFEF